MNDLSVLEKPTRQVSFKGETLTVSPLKVGQIPAFTRAIRPVFAAVAELLASPPLSEGSGGGGEPTVELTVEQQIKALNLDMSKIVDLVAEHGENLIKACAVALRKKDEELGDLDVPEFISLVRAIVEVNADFFVRAMNKEAKAVGINLPPSGAGQTPSSS